MNSGIRKYILAAVLFLAIILLARYLLPLLLPFLLGAALAVGAEPVVRILQQRLRLRRALASGIGVTLVFLLLSLAVTALLALALRELRNLARILPELEGTLRTGLDTADRWLTGLARQAPGELGALLERNVAQFFSGGDTLLRKVGDFLLKLASGVLSHVPGSALGLATGVISSFMISAKLPKIRRRLSQWLPPAQFDSISAAWCRTKNLVAGWLKAQLRLSGVTFALAMLGLMLLRVPHAPLWAVLVAAVDAFPILGTGTVLVPWSLVAFLQGDRGLAFGLLGLYAAIALVRSLLEPRLLGKQLGLDPLVTLIALYTGYRLWGIGGMILAPMLAVAATQLITRPEADQSS